MASGTLARPCPRTPGAQVLPPSELAATGEKWFSWFAWNPVTSDVPLAEVATSPPLSAKPGGVTSDQRESPR